ncbi:MAG: bi-domain-containing oxidoreductase [Acidobacteria bacterium]|nr:bi-domain-containing oxidoreductase [Acidobacteriota bacterium]
MRQIIQDYKTGDLQSVEVPWPECREGGVLVQTDRTLVSAGTERMIVQFAKKSLLGKAMARPDLVRQVMTKVKKEGLLSTFSKVQSKLETPLPLGYSAAGTILEVGPGVKGLLPGDRVACAGMGYASHSDVIWVPKNLTVPIPDGVEMEEASFVTLGAIAMQGVRQSEARLGEIVAVVGLGLLGQLTVQLLKASGCRVIATDLDPEKNALARQFGADFAGAECDFTSACETSSGGRGVDSVIITAATKSNAPVELAGAITRKKGRVVAVGAVGMDLPRKDYYEKELEFRLSTSYGPGRYDPEYEERGHDYPYGYVRWTEQRNMAAFLDLIKAKSLNIKPLITHRIPFADALRAYDLIEGKILEPYMGIVLEYPPLEAGCPRGVTVGKVASEATGNLPAVGLIGAGNFATGVLFPHLRKLKTRLRAVATATPAKAQAVAAKMGVEVAASTADEILADPEVNTVFIATRHNAHADQVIKALAAGKHVFVEKPLCLNEDELARIIEANSRSRSVLMVGFNRRFSPHARELKRFMGGGKHPLVMTYRINAGLIPQDSWIQHPGEGGGRIIGEVCHFVDLLTFLAGSLPERVFAQTLKLDHADPIARDNVAVTIKFRDGSLGTILYSSSGDPGYPKERIEVLAGGRLGVLNDFRELEMSVGGKVTKIKSRGQDKGFFEELSAFLEAVHDGKPSPIAFEEIVATTQATFLIEESINSGIPLTLSAG